MIHTVEVTCPVAKSFRVDQVRGMFDLKAAKTATQRFEVELPDAEDQSWQIGVIVGPSGSGKTTVARDAYGERFVSGFDWPRAGAVVDGFPAEIESKDVCATLTAVGFSSPPSWVKPYHVLSGGERFRCDLARALLSPHDLIAFDEFTSVVDRTVAQIGSAAIAKAIRGGRIQKQFVAVTCHYDVLDWLEPDWVLDMANCQLARGRLRRRPTLELTIRPVHYRAWDLFRRHHYLNTGISVGAKCFLASWGDEPVAFSAWRPAMTRGRRDGDMREHRTVVLPDFQGVGIGNRLSEFCASLYAAVGSRVSSTTSHPAMIRHRSGSPRWQRTRLGRVAKPGKNATMVRQAVARGATYRPSCDRITAGFRYVGPPADAALARHMLAEFPHGYLLRLLERGPTTLGRLARLSLYSRTCVGHVLEELVASKRAIRFPVGHRLVYGIAPAADPAPPADGHLLAG